MNISMRTAEPVVDPTEEAASAEQMATLQAEIDSFNTEERQRNERVDRTRLIERALGAVREAEAGLRRENVEVAKYEAALAVLKKVNRALDNMPEAVIGAQPPADPTSRTPDLLGDLAEALDEILDASEPVINQRLDKARAAVRRYEEALAQARAQVNSLR
jgi:hypothetical protein